MNIRHLSTRHPPSLFTELSYCFRPTGSPLTSYTFSTATRPQNSDTAVQIATYACVQVTARAHTPGLVAQGTDLSVLAHGQELTNGQIDVALGCFSFHNHLNFGCFQLILRRPFALRFYREPQLMGQ